MAILTDYMEQKLLDHIFGQAAFTRPSALYLGLSTTAFADSDNTTTASAKEPSGNAYARVQIDNISEYNTSGDDIRNSSSIDFAEATGSWGSIGYWGIFDSSGSSANMLMHGSFSSATTVGSGDQFRISTGGLEINFPSAIYAGNSGVASANWREQIAYFLGFDVHNGGDENENFLYYSNSTQYFYHNALYLAVSASAFPTSGLTGWEVGTANSVNPTDGYARVKILEANNSNIDYFNAATTSSGTTTISNNVAIQFPEATGSWGNISHFAIFRGSSSSSHNDYANIRPGSTFGGGSYVMYNSQYPLISGSLTSTKTVSSGDRLRFGIGDLVITAS